MIYEKDSNKIDDIRAHSLSILVDNEAGALARVVGMFSARGYNIDSLTVAQVETDENLSRITITTSATERIINSKKIYYADKTHFHHYLIKKKINYIWQSIFILTLMPLILFYITKDIILTILFSLLVYFGLLIKLRKK